MKSPQIGSSQPTMRKKKRNPITKNIKEGNNPLWL